MSVNSTVVACPYCNGQIVAEARFAGRTAVCPYCNGRLSMPAVPPLPPSLPVAPILKSQPDPFDFLKDSTVVRPRQTRFASPFCMRRPAYSASYKHVDSLSSAWSDGAAAIILVVIIGIIAVLVEFIRAAG